MVDAECDGRTLSASHLVEQQDETNSLFYRKLEQRLPIPPASVQGERVLHTASLTLGASNNHIIFSETTVIASAIVILWPFGMFLAAPVDHLIGEPKDAVAAWEFQLSNVICFVRSAVQSSPRTARAN